MLEVLWLLRLISDFFWEYKSVSAGFVFLFPVLFLIYIFFTRRALKIEVPDVILFALMFFLTILEVVSAKTGSLVELFKFYSFFMAYVTARIVPVKFPLSQIFTAICVLALSGFFVASVLGYGFQSWGGARTFVGGYFFKTDMALSALILLIFISVFSKSAFLISLSFLLCAYIVFLTNARIALPLVVGVPILTFVFRKGWVKGINIRFFVFGSIICSLGVLGLFLVNVTGENMLGFDFTDPFSEKNTQGRTVIWAAIFGLYFDSNVMQKIFGMGLGADIFATSLLGNHHLSGMRAHNSFLYMLVCTGIFGLSLISCFFYQIIKRIPTLLASESQAFLRVGTLISASIVIMLWFSLTTEVIIRPQLMILVFFFCGLTVQANQIERKVVNG